MEVVNESRPSAVVTRMNVIGSPIILCEEGGIPSSRGERRSERIFIVSYFGKSTNQHHKRSCRPEVGSTFTSLFTISKHPTGEEPDPRHF